MADIKVRVGAENKIRVIPSIGPTTITTIAGIYDVDTTNLGNGYVLVYDSNTKKWTSTNILTPGEDQNLTINGGNF